MSVLYMSLCVYISMGINVYECVCVCMYMYSGIYVFIYVNELYDLVYIV